jgi:hypothetical protein
MGGGIGEDGIRGPFSGGAVTPGAGGVTVGARIGTGGLGGFVPMGGEVPFGHSLKSPLLLQSVFVLFPFVFFGGNDILEFLAPPQNTIASEQDTNEPVLFGFPRSRKTISPPCMH